jgi:hypothetical protein
MFPSLPIRFDVIVFFAAIMASSGAWAVSPDETDPVVIMKASEGRALGDRMTARLTMTVKDAANREKVRVVRSRSMDFQGGRRSLMLFESPVEDRNTGLLSIDYDEGGRDDDQWLYLPSVSKSTRISGSGKSGAFLGSDLTYADMTRKDTKNYDYKMLEQSVKVGDEDCWLIEATPRTSRERDETGYEKTQIWVSKSKLMPLQVKAWVTAGKKTKLLKFADIEKVDGTWTAKKLMVRTVNHAGKPESTTILTWADLRYNDPSVTIEDFTERRLEKGL